MVRVGAAVAVGIVMLVACNSDGPDEPCPGGGTSSASPYPGPATPDVPTGACSGSEVCDYLVDSPTCSISAWKCTCQHRTWSCYIQYPGGGLCDGGTPRMDASSDGSIEDASADAPDATADGDL
jgi:hypothetical protein